MRSLFRRTFVAFVASFAVLLVVLIGALVAGYNHSLSTWSARRLTMVEETARRVLSGEADAAERMPPDVPVFIYDRDGALIASNRGIGRRREADETRLPVERDGRVLGYFSVGTTAFRSDAANRALAESLVRAAAVGTVVAFGAALVTAWGFARSLTSPAARVAEGIDSITSGAARVPIPEDGAEEVVRIARSANTLAARLQDERRLRSQWAQDVTHDLRTPVASVRAQLEAIVDGVYPADTDTVRTALSELGRIERLIADLEELMRLEQPELSLNLETFSAEDFANSLRQRFQHEIERKGLHWEARILAAHIAADEPLLYRAVSNVVSNAVRYAPEHECITFSVEKPSDRPWVRIRVTNSGPPIAQEEVARLFERLYRGEYGRNTEGSGLGLTIARRVVLLHDGQINVTSSRKEGTVVTIDLPQPPSYRLL